MVLSLLYLLKMFLLSDRMTVSTITAPCLEYGWLWNLRKIVMPLFSAMTLTSARKREERGLPNQKGEARRKKQRAKKAPSSKTVRHSPFLGWRSNWVRLHVSLCVGGAICCTRTNPGTREIVLVVTSIVLVSYIQATRCRLSEIFCRGLLFSFFLFPLQLATRGA